MTVTHPLFIDLKILKLDDVIKLNILKFTYEFNHNLLPSDISNIFDYNSAIHKYKTRSATNQGLFVPEIFTSNYGTKSIKYQGPLLWNDICKSVPSINDVHSLMAFKNLIKETPLICL